MEVLCMANLRDILVKILENLSEKAAIVNQGGVVLYANKAFEHRFLRSSSGRKPLKELWQLDLGESFGERDSSVEGLVLTAGSELFTMGVYLIDSPKKGDRQYLLLDSQGTIKGDDKDSGFSPTDKQQAETLSPEFKELIGNDPLFRKALLIAQRAARADLPVLILGESGTGKEIVAQAIHRTSKRSNNPLVDVNCAAIPDTLIESELFGYEKGAFTGARTEGRSGYFEAADGGTLLMDEIGDASLQSQSKLLRVLEDGCFKRVGGNRNVKVDVRVISSTNQDLRRNIKEKTFREDLFYRLNTFSIQLPPLRDRTRDIPLLVEHFLASNAMSEYRHRKFLPSCMEIFCAYHWPGNVRELKGVVNYAVNMSSTAAIDPGALPSFLFTRETQPNTHTPDAAVSIPSQTSQLAEVLQCVERDLIREALSKSASRTEAIKSLGISRRTFYIKIKQYGLT